MALEMAFDAFMDDSDRETTVSVKPCGVCGFGLFASDKFCRYCGARQIGGSDSRVIIGPEEDPRKVPYYDVVSPSRSFETSLISTVVTEENTYRSTSGPMVNALANSMSTAAPTGFCGRLARKPVSVLISLTIWLMIVLLSPLDAYVASKSVWARSQCERKPKSNARMEEDHRWLS